MRILFFGSDPQVKGIYTVMFELANQLRNNGHTIIGAGLGQGEYAKRAKNKGLKFHIVKPSIIPGLFGLKLSRFLKKHNPDVICASDPVQIDKIADIAEKANIPIVWHLQNTPDKASVKTINRVKSIICSSPYLTGWIKKNFGDKAAQKTQTVPYGVRDIYIDPYSPEDGNPHETTLLFVGRHTPAKGLHHLIGAFHTLSENLRSKSILQLVGFCPDQEYLEHLQSMARQYGLQEQIIFLGPRDDVPNLITEADMLIVPLIEQETLEIAGQKIETVGQEQPCLNVMRAMRASKPVIASEIAPLTDIVIDQETGLLIPPSDPGALSCAIEALITNKTRCETLGQAGRARFDALFQTKHMVKGFETAFASAISLNKSKGAS